MFSTKSDPKQKADTIEYVTKLLSLKSQASQIRDETETIEEETCPLISSDLSEKDKVKKI